MLLIPRTDLSLDPVSVHQLQRHTCLLGSLWHKNLRQSGITTMIVGLLCLWVFTAAFAPVPDDVDTHHLIEGDIALPPKIHGSGPALNTITTRSLWPRGRVSHIFDRDMDTDDVHVPVHFNTLGMDLDMDMEVGCMD